MGVFDDIKYKINYDNKSIFGLALIFIGVVLNLFGFLHDLGISTSWFIFGALRFLVFVLPGFFLIIPNEKVRYNKALSIVCAILICIFLIFGIFNIITSISAHTVGTYNYSYGFVYDFYDIIIDVIAVIFCIYSLICALLLAIPNDSAKPNQFVSQKALNQTAPAANVPRFCRECGAKVNGDLAFCPECGKKL